MPRSPRFDRGENPSSERLPLAPRRIGGQQPEGKNSNARKAVAKEERVGEGDEARREEERGEKREKLRGLGLASKWKSVNHETSGM